MSVKEYNQGDIIEDQGRYYIIVKYKGKFLCGEVDLLTRLKDYGIYENCDTADSLSELYDLCRNSADKLATTVQSNHSKDLKHFKPGEIARNDFLVDYILWQKPKGKEVWVPLNGLKRHDLNELLHIKYNYKNAQRMPHKELFVREFVAFDRIGERL